MKWRNPLLVGLLFLGMVVQLVAYTTLWRPVWRGEAPLVNRDFTILVTAAWLYEQEGGTALYKVERQRAIQETIIGGPNPIPGGLLPFNHPPFLVPFLSKLLPDEFAIAFGRWLAFSAVLIGLSVGLIATLLRRRGWSGWSIALIVGPLLLFFPLHVALYQGQDTVLPLLGVTGWLFGLLTGRERVAGLFLALTALMPQLALLLVAPFLWRRRTVFFWFCLGAGLLAGGSLLLIGLEGLADFLSLLALTAAGEGYGVHFGEMVNLAGWLERAGAPDSVRATISWAGYVLGGIALVFYGARRPVGAREGALILLVSSFVSPHLYVHGLALLWMVAVCAAIVLVEERRRATLEAALLILSASLLSMSAYLPGASWQHWGPLGMMGLLGGAVLWGARRTVGSAIPDLP